METTIKIDGMTCHHCELAVTEELSEIKGVTTVKVDLHPGETSSATIVSEQEIPQKALRLAIEDAGYRIV